MSQILIREKMTPSPHDLEILLDYDKQGLIPGLNESEEQFLKRASYCLNLKQTLVAQSPEDFNTIDTPETKKMLEKAIEQTKQLYGIAPTWVPIVFSNDKMAPWHGGCAWIFQLEEQTPPTAFLQLRKRFATQDALLGIYERNELVAHELAHVGRMTFDEPKYEEILAYRSASSTFRKWLGPIFQSSSEVLLFLIALIFSLAVDLYMMVIDKPDLYSLSLWSKLGVGCLIAVALFRNWKRHRDFNRCYQHLLDGLKEEQLANAVIYRLTDAEIEQFSQVPYDQIVKSAAEMAAPSVRWKVLYFGYFQNKS